MTGMSPPVPQGTFTKHCEEIELYWYFMHLLLTYYSSVYAMGPAALGELGTNAPSGEHRWSAMQSCT